MNKQTKEQIRANLNKELAVNGGQFSSQAELARELGVNQGYLSNILAGKYTDRHPSIAYWNKIASRYQLEQHFETEDYKAGYEKLAEAQSMKKTICFTGEYGFGKSYLFKRYKRQNSMTYIITCRDSMNRKEFLIEVADAIGIKAEEQARSQARLEGQIKEALIDKNALLIFDECEGIKTQVFASMKNLVRLLEQEIGIIVAGKDLYQDLQRKSKRNKPAGALFSRLQANPFQFTGLLSDDITRICADLGLKIQAEVRRYFCKEFPDIRNFKPIINDLALLYKDKKTTLGMKEVEEVFVQSINV